MTINNFESLNNLHEQHNNANNVISNNNTITIMLAYATNNYQKLLTINLKENTTALDAVYYILKFNKDIYDFYAALINITTSPAIANNQSMIVNTATNLQDIKLSHNNTQLSSEFYKIIYDNIGIYGKKIKPDTYILKSGDRLELYRPLLYTPNERRLLRAKKT